MHDTFAGYGLRCSNYDHFSSVLYLDIEVLNFSFHFLYLIRLLTVQLHESLTT